MDPATELPTPDGRPDAVTLGGASSNADELAAVTKPTPADITINSTTVKTLSCFDLLTRYDQIRAKFESELNSTLVDESGRSIDDDSHPVYVAWAERFRPFQQLRELLIDEAQSRLSVLTDPVLKKWDLKLIRKAGLPELSGVAKACAIVSGLTDIERLTGADSQIQMIMLKKLLPRIQDRKLQAQLTIEIIRELISSNSGSTFLNSPYSPELCDKAHRIASHVPWYVKLWRLANRDQFMFSE